MTTPPDDDRYFTVDELAVYSRCSRTVLEDRMRDEADPLPHYRIGRRILIRKSQFDAWLAKVGTPRRVVKASARAELLELRAKKAIGK